MALRAAITASLLVAAGFCRAQQGVAYSAGELANDGSQALYQVNLPTATASRKGFVKANGVSVSALSGLTFGTNGQLYAIGLLNSASQPALMTVATTVPAATVVSSINGLPAIASSGLSLSFGCDGHVWMSSADSNNFWELTPSSGQIRLVGNLGVKITALATYNSVLYGIGGNGNANLYTIATDTAKTTLIGSYTVAASNPVDAGFDSTGALWGLVRNFNPNGNSLPSGLNALYQINTTSGAMTSAGMIANPGQTNLPYPVTLSGLAIGPPVCNAVAPSTSSKEAPASSPVGLGSLIFALLLSACLIFKPKRF